jgi:uncharacterized membrane protein required for colicin V production
MALTLTIACSLTLLVMTLLGVFRGIVRGLLALVGTLSGALLTAIWAPVWSNWLAQQLAIPHRQTLLWGLTCLTFLLCVLLVGYGSALLLPRGQQRIESSRLAAARRQPLPRVGGGLLGFYQGLLTLGLLLRYTSDLLKNQSFNAAVTASPVARVLHEGLGWAFLAPPLLVSAAVLVRALVLLGRRLSSRRSAGPAAPATPGVSQADSPKVSS